MVSPLLPSKLSTMTMLLDFPFLYFFFYFLFFHVSYFFLSFAVNERKIGREDKRKNIFFEILYIGKSDESIEMNYGNDCSRRPSSFIDQYSSRNILQIIYTPPKTFHFLPPVSNFPKNCYSSLFYRTAGQLSRGTEKSLEISISKLLLLLLLFFPLPRNFKFQRLDGCFSTRRTITTTTTKTITSHDKYLFEIIRGQLHFCPIFAPSREKNRKCVIILGRKERALKIRLEIKLAVTSLPFWDGSFVIAPLIEIGNSFNTSPRDESVETRSQRLNSCALFAKPSRILTPWIIRINPLARRRI